MISNVFKYVFIADLISKDKIYEGVNYRYENVDINNQALDIFNKLGSKIKDNGKMTSTEGNFYFVNSENKFYIICVDKNYNEKHAYSFIQDLIKDKVADNNNDDNLTDIDKKVKEYILKYENIHLNNDEVEEDEIISGNGYVAKLKRDSRQINIINHYINTDEVNFQVVGPIQVDDDQEKKMKKKIKDEENENIKRSTRRKNLFLILILTFVGIGIGLAIILPFVLNEKNT